MESQQQERVVIRLFAGYRVDAPLKYSLEHSSLWKDSQIDPRGELVLVDRQGVLYLGTYIFSPTISLDKLKCVEDEVRVKVQGYCPNYDYAKLKLEVFSQLFIQ